MHHIGETELGVFKYKF